MAEEERSLYLQFKAECRRLLADPLFNTEANRTILERVIVAARAAQHTARETEVLTGALETLRRLRANDVTGPNVGPLPPPPPDGDIIDLRRRMELQEQRVIELQRQQMELQAEQRRNSIDPGEIGKVRTMVGVLGNNIQRLDVELRQEQDRGADIQRSIEQQQQLIDVHVAELGRIQHTIERLRAQFRATLSWSGAALLSLSPTLYMYLVLMGSNWTISSALIDEYRRARMLQTMAGSLLNGSNPIVSLPSHFLRPLLGPIVLPLTRIGLPRPAMQLFYHGITSFGWPSQRAFSAASSELSDRQLLALSTMDNIAAGIADRFHQVLIGENVRFSLRAPDFLLTLTNFTTTLIMDTLSHIQPTEYGHHQVFTRDWIFNVARLFLDMATRPADYQRLLRTRAHENIEPSERLAGLTETLMISVPTMIMLTLVMNWIGSRCFGHWHQRRRRLMAVIYATMTMMIMLTTHILTTRRREERDMLIEWEPTPPTTSDMLAELGLQHGALIAFAGQRVLQSVVAQLSNHPYSAIVFLAATALHRDATGFLDAEEDGTEEEGER